MACFAPDNVRTILLHHTTGLGLIENLLLQALSVMYVLHGVGAPAALGPVWHHGHPKENLHFQSTTPHHTTPHHTTPHHTTHHTTPHHTTPHHTTPHHTTPHHTTPHHTTPHHTTPRHTTPHHTADTRCVLISFGPPLGWVVHIEYVLLSQPALLVWWYGSRPLG